MKNKKKIVFNLFLLGILTFSNVVPMFNSYQMYAKTNENAGIQEIKTSLDFNDFAYFGYIKKKCNKYESRRCR